MELVITIQYFEENTIIDTDFDGNKVYNHLIDAQEIMLSELLGRKIYADMQLWLGNNPAPSTIQQELIDKCKPFVLKATELYLIPFLNTPITAKGTMERRGDYTSRANDTLSGLRLDNVRAKVEHYAEQVRLFLSDNRTDFPKWKCEDGDQNFYSTIYLV